VLVLTRRIGERVMVGDDVEVMVLESRSGQVKLGFTAPTAVRIHRREVWERIQLERTSEREIERSAV
jgi:carbon storage regulator